MMPLLRPGEWLWARSGPPPLQRDLLVVFELPDKPNDWLIKRLTGLPGEHVRVAPHEWHLNDRQCVVLGDAREDSLDSRRFGPLSLDALRGWVTRRVWPRQGPPVLPL